MKPRIVYSEGEIIGPYNIIFINELEPILINNKNIRIANFKCGECGKIFSARISNIKNGHTKSCGCMADKARKKTIIEWNNTHPDPWNKHYPSPNEIINDYGIKYIGEGIQKRTPQGVAVRYIIVECPICHCHFECIYENVIRNLTTSCGCSISRGEEKICNILNSLNIIYERQKTFNNLKSDKGWKLKYDFYIPSKNLLIEYDGIQHYKYRDNSGWNTEKNFIETQKRDKTKNYFAKDNNIFLLRIPYTDYNILSKEYLEEKINEICTD